jgi:arabinofuranan 3-O-arabinosyltransferase
VRSVHGSYNRGWDARVGDTELVPVLVEGWQQGFVVPAGTSGDVRLTYGPHGAFQAALIGGLGLVGALLALATLLLVGLRRRDERVVVAASAAPTESRVSRSAPRPRRLVLTALLAALVLAVVSVPLAMGVALGAATTWLPPPAAIVITHRRLGLAATVRARAGGATSGMP